LCSMIYLSRSPVSSLFQDFFQRAVHVRRRDEQPNGFINGAPGFLTALAATCYIKWHGVGDELSAFTPHLHRVMDFHPATLTSKLPAGTQMDNLIQSG